MTETMQQQLTYDDYGVAIICPLEVEMSAMRYMLDEEHPELPSKDGDQNGYLCGRLQGHNVVIAYLPEGAVGVSEAAIVATNMHRSFPKANLRLLVGIGGGVPSKQHDVRLGDVVIGMPTGIHGGIVQYDIGKETITGFKRNGFLEPPPHEWRNRVVKMRSDHRTEPNRISSFINDMIQKQPKLYTFQRPAVGHDVLFSPSSGHIAGELTCQHCEKDQIVHRDPPTRDTPKLFYGLIASGNRVVKNALLRDQIAQHAGGALCFEMEAAGLVNGFRCVVIRGIADYADSHKNDKWHEYAAAAAAGCAKELLSYMKGTALTDSRRTSQNEHWTIDRAINPYFRGRASHIEDIVRHIHNALQVNGKGPQYRIVVTGIGGLGKSEICLHVADQVRDCFWGIFWVDANTIVAAEAGFATIGAQLNLAQRSVNDVLLFLTNCKHQWLLILDNADDVNFDYQKYLPSGRTGVVIITSRNQECQKYATYSISLGGLGKETARELLYTAANICSDQCTDESIADSIATDLLQGHPLAIHQAGAYISKGHCTLSEYAHHYAQKRERVLTYKTVQAQSQYRDVYATFETSSDALRELQTQASGDALDLLSILSFYAPKDVPSTLFKIAWEQGQKILHSTCNVDDKVQIVAWHVSQLPSLLEVNKDTEQWDPFRLREAVTLLSSYALVTTSNTGEKSSISMHPLIHAWARDRQSQKQQQESWLRAACILAISHSPGYDTSIWQRPHIQTTSSVSEAVMTSSGPQLMVAPLLICCSSVLLVYGLHQDLGRLVHFLLNWLGLEGHHVKVKWRQVYHIASQNFSSLRQFRAATDILERLIAFDKLHLPENDEGRLSSEALLAQTYCEDQQPERALPMLERIVKIRNRSLPEDDSEHTLVDGDLALVYGNCGRLQEASAILEKVVRAQKQSLSEDHPYRLAAEYNLAGIYMELGRSEEALPIFEKVVKIQEQSQPEDHQQRLFAEICLAMAYENCGRPEEALAVLEKVVKIQEQSVPGDHPDRLTTDYILAVVYMELGRSEEAVAVLEKAVKIQEQSVPKDDPERVLMDYYSALMYLKMGRNEEALVLFERVVKNWELSRAEDDPRRLEGECKLAVCLWELGQRETAYARMAHVVGIRARVLKADNRDRLYAEERLARMKDEMGARVPDVGDLLQRGPEEQLAGVEREVETARVPPKVHDPPQQHREEQLAGAESKVEAPIPLEVDNHQRQQKSDKRLARLENRLRRLRDKEADCVVQ